MLRRFSTSWSYAALSSGDNLISRGRGTLPSCPGMPSPPPFSRSPLSPASSSPGRTSPMGGSASRTGSGFPSIGCCSCSGIISAGLGSSSSGRRFFRLGKYAAVALLSSFQSLCGDQLEPLAPFHDRRRNPETPSALGFLRKVTTEYISDRRCNFLKFVGGQSRIVLGDYSHSTKVQWLSVPSLI